MAIEKGARLEYKADHSITATVIFVDGEEITIKVDGYAASDAYDLDELVNQWNVLG